jgi:hypothetical protein
MNLYLAAVSTMEPYFRNEELKAENVSVLASFYGISDFEKEYAHKFKRIIIDSGAFTFIRGTARVDWDNYTEKYAEFINRYDIKLFFELDIDPIVGLKEVERLRKKLEHLTGKKPIPVWHISRGKEYFVKMCKEYPYVAIGGIVTQEVPRAVYEKAFPWFIATAHKYGAKIHGLGYTSIAGLNKYHFDSVDSTTWLVGAKYGNVCVLSTTKDAKQQHRPNTWVKDTRALSKYNIEQWIKFQEYAEKHL